MNIPPGLEEELNKYIFSTWDKDVLASPEGQAGKRAVLIDRLNDALTYVVPWMQAFIDLKNSTIVEVGCGSGSSTVALAMNSKYIYGYDIDSNIISAAKARLRAYDLDNAVVNHCSPETEIARISTIPDANVFVFYAVLEHMTIQERIAILAETWKMMRPGSYLVIIETPNRLVWFDSHSSHLEFFHLLPDELAFLYMYKIPRRDYRDSLLASQDKSLTRTRWGMGARFHEVETALQTDPNPNAVPNGP